MRIVLGILIAIAGIILGLYIGIYVLFVGGIMQIVNNIEPLHAKEIVIGILKLVFCELGALPAYFGIVIGALIAQD